jgi:beta-lactamase class A
MNLLIEDIEELERINNLDIGVSINYIEFNEEINYNQDKLYHLASVVKVPFMVEAFKQIDEGEMSLEESVSLKDSFKLSGSGVLKYMREGLDLTVEDLITLMIIISDNTATDTLLDRIGGPLGVDDTMKGLGYDDLHTNMSIREAHRDRGILREPVTDPREAIIASRERRLIFDSACFTASPEGNSGSPRAMTALMCDIFEGELWSGEACDKMMDIMYKQQLNSRIPRKLPRGTLVAHKTGTITGVANDSGIIEIGGDNHCAFTVFTRDMAFFEEKAPEIAYKNQSRIESIMGEIGRLMYDIGAGLSS